MSVSKTQYRSAKDTLDYIDHIKQEMASLLHSRCHLMYSAVHVAAADFDHASTCIGEIIDDLFRAERRSARHIVEVWQQQDRLLSPQL